MRWNNKFYVLLLIAQLCFCQSRYLIREFDRFGYIDKTGKEVIAVKFDYAEPFSGDLALVKNGKDFRFINKAGNYASTEKFIKAESYKDGLAKVWQEDGTSFYIDIKGKKVITTPFVNVPHAKGDYAVVETGNHKMGVYNFKLGKLTVDTVYDNISSIDNQLVSVFQEIQTRVSREENEGVIDVVTGKWRIPLKKFSNISAYHDGYATAHNKKGQGVILDISGKVIFKYDDYFHEFAFVNGIGIVGKGYINTEGKYLYKNEKMSMQTHFTDGKAFAHIEDRGGCIIDKNFNIIAEGIHGYPIIGEDFFCIRKQDGFHEFDNKGKEIRVMNYQDIFFLNKDIVIFTNDSIEPKLYGIADRKGRVLMKPNLFHLDFDFRGDVLKANVGDTDCYLNDKGKIIWRRKTVSENLMNTMVYPEQISLRPLDADGSVNGNWSSLPLSLEKGYADKSLKMILSKEDENNFNVRIENGTNKEQRFLVQDGKLRFLIEALDANKKWKEITVFQTSWCGNSYTYRGLDAGMYWKFIIAKFDGDFETKIRAKIVEYGEGGIDVVKLYSNEFSAKINSSLLY